MLGFMEPGEATRRLLATHALSETAELVILWNVRINSASRRPVQGALFPLRFFPYTGRREGIRGMMVVWCANVPDIRGRFASTSFVITLAMGNLFPLAVFKGELTRVPV